jgi:hypothetical protein
MSTLTHPGFKQQAQGAALQPLWQRVLLLIVLGYEAAGCLAGGGMLIARPDGSLMQMPVSLVQGVFADFLIPGIILFAMGILTGIAFMAVLRRWGNAWLWAWLAIGGLAIWFWVEIVIIQEVVWLHAMWGLPVLLAGIAGASLIPKRLVNNILMICGIASSLLYVAANIIVPMQWPEYSSMSQTVSELSAVAAPTRMLWIVICTPFTLLTLLFSVGIYKYAGDNRKLKIAGALLIAYSTLGILWPFAPMHLRATLAAGGDTFSDTMHLTLGAVTELIYFAALIIVALALDKGFRIYSFATLAVLLVFGTLTFIDAPKVSLNGPTPYIGLYERINIGVFLLWVVVLAMIRMRDINKVR